MGLDSDKIRVQYGYALNRFGHFLGRDPMPSDLNDDTVTAWLKRELKTANSIYTVRERVGRVLALWNWLAKRRMVERFPTIVMPKGPELLPTAMTEEQMRLLFDECLYEREMIEGIRASLWWRSLLAFIWSTGERKGAALACRWKWINLKMGVVTIPASSRKGKRKNGVYRLWPEVASMLASIREPKRDLVWPWPYHEVTFYNTLGRIMLRAGLPDDRKHKLHCLRVSHATWLKVLGGDPTRALMHGDSATTAKHYIDPRQLPAEERRLFVPWMPKGEEHKAADWL